MQTEIECKETLMRPKRERRNPRGVFEKVPGSGDWYIRFVDAQGRFRREKAGTKSAAIDLVRKRKTEALQGKKLPEKLRRATVTFADISRDALAYSKAHKRTYKDDKQRSRTGGILTVNTAVTTFD